MYFVYTKTTQTKLLSPVSQLFEIFFNFSQSIFEEYKAPITWMIMTSTVYFASVERPNSDRTIEFLLL